VSTLLVFNCSYSWLYSKSNFHFQI